MAGLWDSFKNIEKMGFAPGLLGMFDSEDPSKEGMNYLDQIPGETHKNLDPWADYGHKLTQDPGGRLNEIGQSYHQSPGFQFALQQALQGAGHAQAAGGMAGSPQHEFQNMETATQLGNQDYNEWMKNALGLHNEGYTQGQNASTNINDQIIQALAGKSGLAYRGAAQNNQNNSANFNNILQGAGALAAFL